jgi:hypothetical protein
VALGSAHALGAFALGAGGDLLDDVESLGSFHLPLLSGGLAGG